MGAVAKRLFRGCTATTKRHPFFNRECISVRVLQPEPAIGQKTDIFTLLHLKLRAAAIGPDFPLLVAEPHIDVLHVRGRQ